MLDGWLKSRGRNRTVDKPELCFEGCDIVITATNSMSPVYDAEWAENYAPDFAEKAGSG